MVIVDLADVRSKLAIKLNYHIALLSDINIITIIFKKNRIQNLEFSKQMRVSKFESIRELQCC